MTNKIIYVSFNDYKIAKSKFLNMHNTEIIHNSVPDIKELSKKIEIKKTS